MKEIIKNEKDDGIRLQTYMASCGVASRRGSEELIKEGRVFLNAKKVTEMGVKVYKDDIVQVDGETVEPALNKYYIALNKPKGFVCTNYDPNENKYARELINMKDNNLLFNVGRLDKESSGLILFTNDGDFANRMMHPKYSVEKEYIVTVNRPIELSDINKALEGLYIDLPTPYRIKRYDLMPRTKTSIRITLTEGKNREIRKIFSFLDYDVKNLIRIRIGCVELGDLEVGKWRNISKNEINGLLSGKGNSKEVKNSKVRNKNVRREKSDNRD